MGGALADRVAWENSGKKEHFVQFYENSAQLVESVSGFTTQALDAGAACIVIAAPANLAAIEQHLQSRGRFLEGLRADGQYVALDAGKLLSELMADGWPQKERFEERVGRVVDAANARFPETRVFGEMVALLWSAGRYGAAIRLEHFWNELAKARSFSLFCAYPKDSGANAQELAQICAAHSHVIPAGEYGAAADSGTPFVLIERLQEKIRALESHAQDRRALERKLAEREQELSASLEKLQRLNETLEQRVAERTEALRASECQLQQLVSGITDCAVYMLDVNGRVASWNPGAEHIHGYTRSEAIGCHLSQFYTAEDRANRVADRVLAIAASKGKYEAEAWRMRKDGTRFWANVLIDPIWDTSGALIGFAKLTRDMTERRALQEQLHQSQKMEAIGQLTGGVAHDFNNLLTVILGNLEAIGRHVSREQNDRLCRAVDQATRGAQRAATLTQQLLAFSRRQPLNPKLIDVNRLVTGMSDLIRRTIGENIEVEALLTDGSPCVEVDPNQLESALINLAVNARDAMPNRGRLTLETAYEHLDLPEPAEFAELTAGEYVVISIRDTGEGMSREVMARAFEPFFTTKPIGEGTGLGLSQVYGFVRQSHGHVKLSSQVGQGTIVKIYLPRLLGADLRAEPAAPGPLPEGRPSETILVVEDNEDVRAYSTESLRDVGFTVLEATDASSALRALELHPEVRLLFTDIGLPGMNGRELVDEVRRRRPDLKVLFTTGYARDAVVHDGRLDQGVELLTKPFTRANLAARVRHVLDA